MRPISAIRQRIEDEGCLHTVRRGWRGRWHFENLPCLITWLDVGLQLIRLKSWGMRNALDIQVESIELRFTNLPRAFDGYRLLLLTDLHIDGNEPLVERVLEKTSTLEYDLCLLGGDYAFPNNCESTRATTLMTRITQHLTQQSRVVGILGNHDRYSMAECLSATGVEMLINEYTCVEKDGACLYLSGLDDGHYFKSADIGQASTGISEDAFKIILGHTPEMATEAARAGYHLYLAGHTHGGQVCLPGGIALVTCATIPRRMLKGMWLKQGMIGYTCRGTGTSGLPVRFYCPPEITCLTLRC
ncbi:metallophosphoesterase [Planctomycetota bacterium]